MNEMERRSAAMIAELDALTRGRFADLTHQESPKNADGSPRLCRRCRLPQTISDEHDRNCTWNAAHRRGF